MTEPKPGWEFRESLLVLLGRAQRGRLTPADGDLLRSHADHLLRTIDTAHADREQARRIAVALENENAELLATIARAWTWIESANDGYGSDVGDLMSAIGTPPAEPPTA